MKIQHLILLILLFIITLSGCTKEPEPAEEISQETLVKETATHVNKTSILSPTKCLFGFKKLWVLIALRRIKSSSTSPGDIALQT